MNLQDHIIESFIANNPKKRTIDRRWKHTHPEHYEAAVKLYNMGYSIQDIAKHVDCKYDVLRKTFVKDKVFRPKKYVQKHKVGIERQVLKKLDLN